MTGAFNLLPNIKDKLNSLNITFINSGIDPTIIKYTKTIIKILF